MINALTEIETARQMVADGKMRLDDFAALLLGYLIGNKERPEYYEYIQSPAWKAKAEAAKKRAGYKCQVCNGTHRLEAHHRTYDRLGNERPEDITVLCHSCHELYSKRAAW
jgi:hypothetical protein